MINKRTLKRWRWIAYKSKFYIHYLLHSQYSHQTCSATSSFGKTYTRSAAPSTAEAPESLHDWAAVSAVGERRRRSLARLRRRPWSEWWWELLPRRSPFPFLVGSAPWRGSVDSLAATLAEAAFSECCGDPEMRSGFEDDSWHWVADKWLGKLEFESSSTVTDLNKVITEFCVGK